MMRGGSARMIDTTAYRPLLMRSALALAGGATLVALCYFFVDRSVAFFVRDHGVSKSQILPWLTYPPAWLESAVPVILVVLAVRRAWGAFSRLELALIAGCLAVLVAEQCREG